MTKRKLCSAELSRNLELPSKRSRPANVDRLSHLSDELLLRVLSHLSLAELNLVRTLSRRFNRVAGDSQLWKVLYYDRFVRPRVARLPGIDPSSAHLPYSSGFSRWPEDEILAKSEQKTNWKFEYKRMHNWAKGTCAMIEIHVADQPPIPPLLVCLHDGVVYTADSISGLRAWSSKKERKLLGSIQFERLPEVAPTAIAVDTKSESVTLAFHRVALGFDDGSFTIFEFSLDTGHFVPIFTSKPTDEILTAVAACTPYLITTTATQLLTIYKFSLESESTKKDGKKRLKPPTPLFEFKSHSVLPPVALGIRSYPEYITATLAFATPTLPSGWKATVQEMRLTPEGDLLDSRMVSSSATAHSLSSSLPSSLRSSRASTPMASSLLFSAASPTYTKPTSISYSHPYLLLSHPDNTLTLYLLTSTPDSLSISGGSRLWGHTSSVAGAHIGNKGKAVSVTRTGDELRIWDLEGATTRSSQNGTAVSVKIQPGKTSNVTSVMSMADFEDMTVVRGWIGFDDENVVILKEKNLGSQNLVVYDFT